MNISLKWLLNLLCKGLCGHSYILDSTSSACYYIDDIPCSATDGVCDFEVVVSAFGGALNIGLISRALHVNQLFPHFLISGGAFRGGRGSQRRVRSRSIYIQSLSPLVLLR